MLGGTKLACRRKASRLAAYRYQEYSFDSFVGFVTKKK